MPVHHFIVIEQFAASRNNDRIAFGVFYFIAGNMLVEFLANVGVVANGNEHGRLAQQVLSEFAAMADTGFVRFVVIVELVEGGLEDVRQFGRGFL